MSDLDQIIDYEDDGTPVRFSDVLAGVAQLAQQNGKRLVIGDGDNPTFQLVEADSNE